MYLSFFVRDKFTAAPVTGLAVPLKRHSDNGVVTTVTSDSNGFVTFQLNGHPGDVYAEVVQGGETRRYSTRTTAPSGSFQVGEAGEMMQAIGPGVIESVGNGLMVAPATGMQVAVPSGGALLAEHYFRQYSNSGITLAASHPTLGRLDLVVARVDRATRVSTLGIVTGTPAASPVAPALTQTSAVWEEGLARVQVDAGATTIIAGRITDIRRFVVARIPTGAITTDKLATGSVTGPKIASGAVGSDAIALDAVNQGRITDGAISTAKLAALSVTLAKLAANSVDATKIVDATITGAKLAAGTVAESNLTTAVQTKLNASGSGTTPADGSVTTAKIVDGAVTEAKLASAVQTKLNAAGGAMIVAQVERDGTAGFATNTSTTGVALLSGTIVIPSDGRTYDVIVEGFLGFFNSTNVWSGIAVRFNSTLTNYVGGAGATYRDFGKTLVTTGVTAGSYPFALWGRVASGTMNYDGGWVTATAVPR